MFAVTVNVCLCGRVLAVWGAFVPGPRHALNFAPQSCALKTKTKPIAIKVTQRLFHKCESNSRALSLESLQTTSNASTHTLFLSLGLEPTSIVGYSLQILFKTSQKPRSGFCANGKLDSSLNEIPKSDPLRIKSFHSVLKLLKCVQKLKIRCGFLQKDQNSQLQNETSATAVLVVLVECHNAL